MAAERNAQVTINDENGRRAVWGVACSASDTEKTVREHVAKVRPKAEFISVEFVTLDQGS